MLRRNCVIATPHPKLGNANDAHTELGNHQPARGILRPIAMMPLETRFFLFSSIPQLTRIREAQEA